MTFENISVYPRRMTPPISSLTAFEAVARLKSFTEAATELSLTQSAVSRQVSSLEELLGVVLFEGNRRKQLNLTPSGEYYADQIRVILSSLVNATSETMAIGGQGRALRIGIPPTFGSRWLIERVPKFFAAHPGISIAFQTHIPHRSKQNLENLDALIDFLPSSQAEPHWHKLMELDLVLVATQNISTRILKKSNDSSTSIKFLVHNAEFQELKDLLSRSGMESIRSFPTLTFESYVMLFQAIDSELGIGLAPRILIEKELNSGRFVQVLNVQMQSKNFGYLIVKSNRENYAPLEIFRTWLVELN